MSIFGQLGNTLGLGAPGSSNQMYGAVANGGIGNAQQMSAAQYNQMVQASAQQQKHRQAHIQAAAQLGHSNNTNPLKSFNPNELEAFQIPLSQLVTMWQVRFGETWVSLPAMYNETGFFQHAHDRLRRAEKFEVFDNWVRLKEDV